MTKEKRKGVFIKIFIPVTIIIFFLIFFLMHEERTLSQNSGGNFADQAYKHINDYRFPYDISHPSQKFKLPHRLNEVSGLSYFEPNKLLCIQDEKGAIYVFDLEKGKVEEKFIFGEENDYEDIEIVKKTVYILKSNGTLLKVKKFMTDTPKVKKYTTLLSKKNDAEGLAFDAESESLFIACKGAPYLTNKDKSLEGKKAVYQFDLQTKELLEKPVYLIDKVCVKDSSDEHSSVKIFFTGLISLLDPRRDSGNFRPSGIAVHPKTKNIYMISSADRRLLVMSRKGEIITSMKLPKKIFKQPEGICFNPEGDLFISNEKKGKRANILKFDYRFLEK